MSSILQFPSQRLVYGSIVGGEPLFVSDALIAEQTANDAIKAIGGIQDGTDTFFILQGLDYNQSANTYGTGIIYFNGAFYYSANTLSEGNRLIPASPTQSFNQLFADGTVRPTYQTFTAVATTNPTGSTPVFTGNMNAYRIGNKFLQAQIVALQSLTSTLGSAAFLQASATQANGVIPLWDSVYTKTQINNLISVVGEIKTVYSSGSDAFATSFDSTGLGYVSPWIGWALMNGATHIVNGVTYILPNAAGRNLLGVGTGTDANGNTFSVAAQGTGGEFTHKLTTGEMPTHSHNIKYNNNAAGGSGGGSALNYGTTSNINTDATGGDGYHNNVQPYIGVYFVQRIY
jgi:microcystin-dependent protein